REKFLGTYNTNESCDSGTYTYTLSVSTSSTGEDQIVINNFAGLNVSVRATVNGQNLTYNDTQQGITITGSGSIAGSTMTLIYTGSSGGQTESCTATCIKQ
ncbi:MAG: hypothetical protein AAF193_06665, partial [Bacteroidota bacterium]